MRVSFQFKLIVGVTGFWHSPEWKYLSANFLEKPIWEDPWCWSVCQRCSGGIRLIVWLNLSWSSWITGLWTGFWLEG